MPDQDKPGTKNQRIPRVSPLGIRFRPDTVALARGTVRAPQVPQQQSSSEAGELMGVYIISVAARLLEMHPQTLRKYERLGLVRPSRTIGMLRLYSEEDIEKLRLIKHLEGNLGLNLAGVEFFLNLVSHLVEMHQKLSDIKGAERFSSVVEREIAQLFRSLDLPLQE